MRPDAVVLNRDGVIIPGRATTWLAKAYGITLGKDDYGKAQKFKERLLSECGKSGPFRTVSEKRLRAHFQQHEDTITGIECLNSCLTLARKDGILGPEHTIYAKNGVLEGLTVKRIKEITGEIPLNRGVEETLAAISDAGIKQVLISQSNAVSVDYHGKRFGMQKYRGCPPILSHGGRELIYDSDEHYDLDDAVTTGEITGIEPFGVAVKFLGELEVDHGKTLWVNDDAGDLAKTKRYMEEKGHRPTIVCFLNKDDPLAMRGYEKSKEIAQGAGIPVIGSFREIANYLG